MKREHVEKVLTNIPAPRMQAATLVALCQIEIIDGNWFTGMQVPLTKLERTYILNRDFSEWDQHQKEGGPVCINS
jgi:hypothetical protein